MEQSSLAPRFLDPREIAQSCAEAELSEGATDAFLNLAARITTDPVLYEAAVAVHHKVYETTEEYEQAHSHADTVFVDDAPLLHALLMLESTRLVRERHHARGVPPEVSRAVNARHGSGWLKSADKGSPIMIDDWIPWWFRYVASGKLYRLGRLEFAIEAWEYPFGAYIHNQTNELIVLANAGLQLTDDGYVTGTQTWTTTLAEDDDAITGTPISPRGHALRQPVRLPRSEWQQILKAGDPIVDIHIPREGELSLEALHQAHADAEPFFDRYYPDQRFVAYICDSWMFSPQLEAMLGPDSNIVRWQREGYLLPSDDGADSFLTFTFGADTIDTATAPQDTRLRRAVIAHLDRGEPLRCGGYLLLRRDLDRFGAQPYRESSEQAIGEYTCFYPS
jgi:hypothetical protein